jgi:hypothetical protein
MNEKSKFIPRGKNPHLHQSDFVAYAKIGEEKRRAELTLNWITTYSACSSIANRSAISLNIPRTTTNGLNKYSGYIHAILHAPMM